MWSLICSCFLISLIIIVIAFMLNHKQHFPLPQFTRKQPSHSLHCHAYISHQSYHLLYGLIPYSSFLHFSPLYSCRSSTRTCPGGLSQCRVTARSPLHTLQWYFQGQLYMEALLEFTDTTFIPPSFLTSTTDLYHL